MERIFRKLGFSKLLAAILVANISAMVLCSALHARVKDLILIYTFCFLPAIYVSFSARVKRIDYKISRGQIAWCLTFATLIAATRIPYVLEWLPGNNVSVIGDDPQRLIDLISLTMTDNYPVAHATNQEFLLSYYYAALLPMAFLKLACPLLTLKDTLFIGNALYQFLFLLSLLEVANVLLPSRTSISVMAFLTTAFSGLDWVVSVLHGEPLIGHHEWWLTSLSSLHGDSQVSSFFTLLWWCINQFIGAYGCIIAYVTLWSCTFSRRWLKPLWVGLLLISCLYSSTWALFSLIGFLVVEYRFVLRRLIRPPVSLILLIFLLIPSYTFFGRLPDTSWAYQTFHIALTGSFLADKILSFPIWLVLVSTVELAAIPLILPFFWGRLSRRERSLILVASLFFLSTYVIKHVNWNNYSTRGMILPTFVYFFVFARHVTAANGWSKMRQKRWRIVSASIVAGIFALGTGGELLFAAKEAVRHMAWNYELRGQATPEYILLIGSRDLARNRNHRRYVPRPQDRPLYLNAEQLVSIPLEDMRVGERERLRMPLKSWLH